MSDHPYRIRQHRDGYRMVWPGRVNGPLARPATPQEVDLWHEVRRLREQMVEIQEDAEARLNFAASAIESRTLAVEIARTGTDLADACERLLNAHGARDRPGRLEALQDMQAALRPFVAAVDAAHDSLGVRPRASRVPAEHKPHAVTGKMSSDGATEPQAQSAGSRAGPTAA